MTLLRRSMIHDMTIRNMSPLTQNSYFRAVKNFSKFFRRSPDKLTFKHVPEYQLHLVSRGLGPRPSIKSCVPCGSFTEQRSAGLGCPNPFRWDVGLMFLQVVNDLDFRTAFVTIYAIGCACQTRSRSRSKTSTAPGRRFTFAKAY